MAFILIIRLNGVIIFVIMKIHQLLINKQNPLPDNYYALVELIIANDSRGNEVFIEKECYENFLLLKECVFQKKYNRL